MFIYKCPCGGMVDTLVSKTSVERRAGSSPVRGTDCCPMVSGEWVDINTEKKHHHEGKVAN